MKLSNAIREGAKLKPQCFESLYDKTGTCALGAAVDFAVCGIERFYTTAYLEKYHLYDEKDSADDALDTACTVIPALTQPKIPLDESIKRYATLPFDCKVCGDEKFAFIESYLVHLNDWHLLTREEIADIVEKLEQERKL